MAGQHVITLNEGNFQQEVLNSSVPVLVDFWATWCGPCRAIAPAIDALAEDYVQRAKVGKIDVDANPGLANQFQVQSIPTLMVFKDGRVVEQVLGARPKPALAAMIDKHLK